MEENKKEEKEYDFKVILLQPEVIFKHMHNFLDGVQRIIEHSVEDISSDEIYNDVLKARFGSRGELLPDMLYMWVILIDDKYAGFITTRLDVKFRACTYLTLKHVYLKNDLPKNVIEKGFEFFIKKKAEWNIKRVRGFSKRKGWGKRLENLGWKESYTEYYYE
jgi:hypothetical protein